MNASARPSPPASIPLPSWHGSDSANYDLFAKAGQTHVRSAVRRRGLPDERDLARVRPEETDIRELVGSVSSLMAVARDDDGRIYAVHMDNEYGEARNGGGVDVQAKLFVSSMMEGGSEACPDTQVPTSDVGRPRT